MKNKHLEIFFDLDGTLIDISQRHYTIYYELITEYQGIPLSKNIYWKLKRNKTPLIEILKKSLLSEISFKAYEESFIKNIELSQYLLLDTIFPYTHTVLNSLQNFGYNLYLVSYRRNIKEALQELHHFGLINKFKDIRIGHKTTSGSQTKTAYIQELSKAKQKIIIGDTEDDILAAKKLDAISIGVLTGIRNKKSLAELQPDYLFSTIASLPSMIENTITRNHE
jgi:phosphoglycolate phosphatase